MSGKICRARYVEQDTSRLKIPSCTGFGNSSAHKMHASSWKHRACNLSSGAPRGSNQNSEARTHPAYVRSYPLPSYPQRPAAYLSLLDPAHVPISHDGTRAGGNREDAAPIGFEVRRILRHDSVPTHMVCSTVCCYDPATYDDDLQFTVRLLKTNTKCESRNFPFDV